MHPHLSPSLLFKVWKNIMLLYENLWKKKVFPSRNEKTKRINREYPPFRVCMKDYFSSKGWPSLCEGGELLHHHHLPPDLHDCHGLLVLILDWPQISQFILFCAFKISLNMSISRLLQESTSALQPSWRCPLRWPPSRAPSPPWLTPRQWTCGRECASSLSSAPSWNTLLWTMQPGSYIMPAMKSMWWLYDIFLLTWPCLWHIEALAL